MALETEVKFRLPTRGMATLAKAPLPRFQKSRPERTRQVSTYFDTAKHKLKRHGLTLRVRKAPGKTVQTVKADMNGPTGRGEWEAEISGQAPDLQRASDSPLRKLNRKRLRRKLRPVFKTQVQRTIVPLRSGSAEIELALDQGRIIAGRHKSRIAEAELELKGGRPSELFRLARTFEHRAGAELFLPSKAERGYALSNGEQGAVHSSEPIVLQPQMQAIDAFKVIARSTIRHFADNADAVRAADAEGIHQMRVGLRRTRAAISLFAKVLPTASTERIKSELKWLTNELAPARELDVFVRKQVEPAARSGINKRGARAIKADFTARRQQALARARAALSSSRFRLLLIDVLEWLETQTQARAEMTRDCVAKFADKVLHVRLKKIRKGGKKLDTLSPQQRHKLRIRIKKLRYALQFFDSLYAGKSDQKRLARLSDGLKTLQDALGSLNDFAAHRKMAADAALHAPRPHRRARAFMAGVILGQEDEHAKPLLKTAGKTIKHLGALP